VVFSCCF